MFVVETQYRRNCVLSELARDTVLLPERYSSSFTSDPSKKQTLLIFTEQVDDIDSIRLANTLRSKIPSPSLYNLAVDDHFGEKASLPGFSTVCAASLAAAASPYYNYITTRCGIPHFAIMGDEAAWEKLEEKLRELKKEIVGPNPFGKYADRVADRVKNIIHYAFHAEASLASIFFGGRFMFFLVSGFSVFY